LFKKRLLKKKRGRDAALNPQNQARARRIEREVAEVLAGFIQRARSKVFVGSETPRGKTRQGFAV